MKRWNQKDITTIMISDWFRLLILEFRLLIEKTCKSGYINRRLCVEKAG